MKDHSRRSFVKTSAATGLTFTFAGLIRAHGQSGGGTTWNSEVTIGSTFGTDVSTTWNQEATYVATTWPGNNYSTTTDPNGSYGETTNPYQEYTTTYDPNVYETTQPETEAQTTEAISIPEVWEYALWCKQDPLANRAVYRGRMIPGVGVSFVYQAVQDIKKVNNKTSSTYFYLEGRGPLKDEKAASFRFKGRVHAIVSTDSRDDSPQQKLGNELAVYETDTKDIFVKGAIDLDMTTVLSTSPIARQWINRVERLRGSLHTPL